MRATDDYFGCHQCENSFLFYIQWILGGLLGWVYCNLELFLFLRELCFQSFHKVLHGVARRADVCLLLGCQLCLEVVHLLLHLGHLASLILGLSCQSLHLGSMILLQPATKTPIVNL